MSLGGDAGPETEFYVVSFEDSVSDPGATHYGYNIFERPFGSEAIGVVVQTVHTEEPATQEEMEGALESFSLGQS